MGETEMDPNVEGFAMSIHQQATITADPQRVYEVLADAEELSALSGKGGTVARTEGEEFAAFDGNVTGRQIELVPGTRIVQAWRFPHWEPGQYSLVTFTLTAVDGGTHLAIDQHGEPDDWHDHITANWPTFYLTPLTEHFAAA
jgi:activator of HSP90 ATPase